MICDTCGRTMQFGVVPATCSATLGYRCKHCNFIIRLSKSEIDDRFLTVCGNCHGSGKIDMFEKPLGFARTEEGNLVRLQTSASIPFGESNQKSRRLVKCDWCDGKGWYETVDWSRE